MRRRHDDGNADLFRPFSVAQDAYLAADAAAIQVLQVLGNLLVEAAGHLLREKDVLRPFDGPALADRIA